MFAEIDWYSEIQKFSVKIGGEILLANRFALVVLAFFLTDGKDSLGLKPMTIRYSNFSIII